MKANIFFKSIAYTIILFSVGTTVSAQMTQKIGGNPFYMEPSAVLELESTTKGFLLPRMTQVQMNAIPSPPAGMMVYCTDCGNGELRVKYSTSWGIPALNLSGDVNATVNVSGSNVTTIQPNKVLSSMILDGEIVNSDVSATAAIAGTKIAPNFGSQNVVTTGTLGAGATSLSTLSTSGAATLNSAAVTNNATVGGTLGVTGAATLGSTLNVTGTTTAAAINATNVAASGTATVTGATSLNGGLTMDTDKFTVADATGNTAIAGTLGVTGATSLTTLGTSGAATLNSAAVTNNATVGGTLGVTGATTVTALTASGTVDLGTDAIQAGELSAGAVATSEILNGTIINEDVDAAAAIAGTKIAPNFGSQNVVTTGTLGAGATSLSTLSTSGAATLNSAAVTNNATVGGTLVVTGAATLGSTLNVTGTTTAAAINATNVAASGTATVTGVTALNGGLTMDTDKFTVADGTGNTAIAGTLGVTGVATFTAKPILSALTALKAVFTDGSKGLVSTEITGTGNVVMSTSPTLVTPALGTPSALVGTNITGTATNFTASNVTTNANLTGMVTSVGNTASLGSFTSANLLAAVSDETGSGAAVFATSPTLVTPTLGVASATTVTTTNLVAGTNTYPTTQGSNGQVLMTNGTGTLSWGTPAPSVIEVADEFTATAAQTSFTLTQTPSVNSKVKMYINGIRISNTAYTVSGTTLTYIPASNGSYALAVSDRIQFDYFK
jgi:hypothetical protein